MSVFGISPGFGIYSLIELVKVSITKAEESNGKLQLVQLQLWPVVCVKQRDEIKTAVRIALTEHATTGTFFFITIRGFALLLRLKYLLCTAVLFPPPADSYQIFFFPATTSQNTKKKMQNSLGTLLSRDFNFFFSCYAQKKKKKKKLLNDLLN